MNCAFFGCGLNPTKDFLGDDGKSIKLCSSHYELVVEAVKRRFKK